MSVVNMYKPSIYNRICEDGENLAIYNSYQGIKSIHKVSACKKEKICEILKRKTLLPDNDPDINKLIDWGFIVPISVDEQLRKEALYEEVCNNNNLHLLVYTTNDCNFR